MQNFIFIILILTLSCAQRRQIAFNYERLESLDNCTSANCEKLPKDGQNVSASTILTPGDNVISPISTNQPKASCESWQLDSVSSNLQWPEISGLAVSKQRPDHLYHIEDSGRDNKVIITNESGQLRKTVSIVGVENRDWESLSYGKCKLSNNCLFIAETGDNSKQHSEYKIISISEESLLAGRPEIHITRFKFENSERHDTEAIAYNPKSDSLFLFTKGSKSKVYEIKSDGLNSENTTARYKFDLNIDRVTGASISSDGNKFLILNYSNTYEFSYDITKSEAPSRYDRRISKSYRSPQQEAVSYSSSNESFYVSSEQKSPLRKYTCE